MSVETFNSLLEAEQLREQLGSDKRKLMFLFGAGTSQAAGLDGVIGLTAKVREKLSTGQQVHYDRILGASGAGAHVEDVLNRIRLLREYTGDRVTSSIEGLTGAEAAAMDQEICAAIYSRVEIDPVRGYETHADFGAWIGSIQRDRAPEIFTTNYDLLIEKGLEIAEVPYFDGFIGTVDPYFSASSCEVDESQRASSAAFPKAWTRLWKLHGSIGWRTNIEALTNTKRVVRLPRVPPKREQDLLIFPSREKYSESRRMPFVALHDRFRRMTAVGESLLVICGYSFGDQHINETIFSNLRSNNRLSATVMLFDSIEKQDIIDKLLAPTRGIQNLTVYAPDGVSVGGVVGKWSAPPAPSSGLSNWPFWDDSAQNFILGDFAKFTRFLQEFVGARSQLSARGGSTNA